MTGALHLSESTREERRAAILKNLRTALAARALSWTMLRGGIHVVIRVPRGDRVFDFWPGTGNWRQRDNTTVPGELALSRISLRRGYGVLEMLAEIDKP